MSDDMGGQEIGGARRRRLAAEDAAAVVDGVGDGPPRRRRDRKPFGNMDQKLYYPPRPGFVRYWFNDVPGRLMRAEEAGYSKVNGSDGKPVTLVVGVARGGGPLTAYLHEIPAEDYQEDQAAHDADVHERLGQIERGSFERPSGRDGQLRYAGSTKGDIRIESGTRR